ncbi:WD40 repeat-like protein [Amylocystis lapponica]|nr:WD40 repeat-like protein [Amylocystis lapponica]
MDHVYSTVSSAPLTALSVRRKSRLLSASFDNALDRVNVLGDHRSGHTGCVNALSWARDGEVLVSGGDDCTVRLWRIDANNVNQEYPFACDAVIHTGHTGNIFNAQMLPNSSRIATVAGDSQVRICDIGEAAMNAGNGSSPEYTSRQAHVRTLRCHTARTKRIVTEESPDLFLTVSEDGTVRQHDLRIPHNCNAGACSAILARVNCELSTLALSPLTPYQFVVAGESPYGYLFDRRQAPRVFREEWDLLPESDNVTTCVRRFGRISRGMGERPGYEHITGARMSTSNGHEVLMTYSSDAVYLYSTRDEPRTSESSGPQSLLQPNPKRRRMQSVVPSREVNVVADNVPSSDINVRMEEDIERILSENEPDVDMEATSLTGPDEHDDEEDADTDEEQSRVYGEPSTGAPVILPRARFVGACNVETVKDVNFLGPQDEFVVSGSDDGNFFMWRKSSGKLHDILEGDGSVVNVIEGHPHLPLVAVSGIDTTVKLFAPAHRSRTFSRMQSAESIMTRNAEASSRRFDLTDLLLHHYMAREAAADHEDSNDPEQCRFQ